MSKELLRGTLTSRLSQDGMWERIMRFDTSSCVFIGKETRSLATTRADKIWREVQSCAACWKKTMRHRARWSSNGSRGSKSSLSSPSRPTTRSFCQRSPVTSTTSSRGCSTSAFGTTWRQPINRTSPSSKASSRNPSRSWTSYGQSTRASSGNSAHEFLRSSATLDCSPGRVRASMRFASNMASEFGFKPRIHGLRDVFP